MKKALSLVFLAGIVSLLCLKPAALAADYRYSLTKDTPQWKEETDTQAKVKQLQLNRAKDIMTTDELLETVLNYPFLSDIYLASSSATVIDNFAATFDGVQGLLARKDAGSVLLSKQADLAKAGQQPETVMQSVFVELVLLHPAVYSRLDEAQAVELNLRLRHVLASDRPFNDMFLDAIDANPKAHQAWSGAEAQDLEPEAKTAAAEENVPTTAGALLSIPLLGGLLYALVRYWVR